MYSDADLTDKKSEKKLQFKVFISFSIVTLLLSILFIFEGYYASVEFGKAVENIQLHERTMQVIQKIDSLEPILDSDEFDDDYYELINLVEKFHTNNQSAVVFTSFDKHIYSIKKFKRKDLEKVIKAIEEKTNNITMNHHYHFSDEYCEDDNCLIEVNGDVYNWMSHTSEKFGKVILIQSSNVTSLANSIVLPRMVTSSAVVIWIGLWASLAIAIFIAKMVKTSNDLRLYPLYHDPVTGLANTKSLENRLNSISENKNDIRHYNLLFISIDNLETLEYNYGYELKEQCFKVLSNRLKNIEDDDFIGIFQSNTFYLLSHHVTTLTIEQYLENKMDQLCEPILTDGLKFIPTISQGIVNFEAHECLSHEVIGHTKLALNKAKKMRSRSYTYSSKEDDETKKVNELTHDLIHAIENNEFVLYYQPKINLSTGEVCSVEALVRWQHPTRGLLFPGDFIDLIENSIIANDFTSHLIDIALLQSQEWLKAGLNLPIAVNVSPHDLEDDKFVNHIIELHESGQLNEHVIEIELTEIENSLDITHLAKMLQKLKDINIDCAIDDFGTGMGSLTYLKYIPVSIVKIDRSFVMDMDTNPASNAIVESTIKLANQLGCKVVAEGIETKEIAQLLTEMECELAQGYFFSKAITGNELQTYVLNHTNTMVN